MQILQRIAIVYLRHGLHVTGKPGAWWDQTPCHHYVRYEGLWWTDYERRGLLPERRTGTGTCLPRCKRHETRARIILPILGARLFHVARATDKQKFRRGSRWSTANLRGRGVRLAKWPARRHSRINVWIIARLSREFRLSNGRTIPPIYQTDK